MNHSSIRRTAALFLALVLSISLAAPAWAVENPAYTIKISGPPTVEAGKSMELTAEWDGGKTPTGDDGVSYTWSTEDGGVTFGDGQESSITVKDNNKVTVKAGDTAKSDVTVRVVAKWKETGVGQETKAAEFKLAVTAAAGGAGDGGRIPAEGISLNKTTLTLTAKKTEKLTASVSPANATDKVIWTTSDEKIATVSDDGTVTAVSHGTAVITAAAGDHTASCTVTVPLSVTIVGEKVWTDPTPGAGTLSVSLIGAPEGTTPTIRWSAAPKAVQAGLVAPTFSGTGAQNGYAEDGETVVSTTVTGTTVNVTGQTAGIFVITAEYLENDEVIGKGTMELTICGIILSGTSLKAEMDQRTGKIKKTMEMPENGSAVLSATFCDQSGYSSLPLEWSSSDPGVVSVMPDAGILNAGYEGTAEITVRTEKGDYSARCTVTVVEDTSAVADNYGKGYTASVSDPLLFKDVYDDYGRLVYSVYKELESICLTKTEAMTTERLPLLYITNLFVPTDQGTLYYNYNTESDTGFGVGANDQFTSREKAGGSRLSIDKLYFVPKKGFSGPAEITFTAIAQGNRNFTGTIKVNVIAGSGGSAGEISYAARAGEPVWFSVSDFDAFCQGPSGSGRNFSYVIFSLPKSGDGMLYYNYAAGSGVQVSNDTRFSRSGRYSLDDVCFVPNAALADKSKVTISFRAVDTSGAVIDGTIVISVTAVNTGADPSSVTVSSERGRPVTLQSSLFYDACQRTIGDILHFVTFTLPDPTTEGILYYDYRSDGSYDGRVTAGTHYYYSGVPGLGSVSFVPAPGATGRIAISYTGYGYGGASYSGTLYIQLEEADHSTIHYFVAKGGSVTFSAADFYSAGMYQTGTGVYYVTFTDLSNSSYDYFDFGNLGRLYYNYRSGIGYGSVYPWSYYYYSSSSNTRLGLISFRAGNETGTVTIPYTAYDSNRNRLFEGKVVIQVGSVAPDDVNLSCRNGEHTSPLQLILGLYGACSAVMNENLSYIEITSVPDAAQGRLYLNYNGFGTGRVVEPGERFYSYGSPGIGQLTFVPHAGFSGEAEITYIGYSYVYADNRLEQKQDQVSGRVLVDVTRSTTSQYFDDMGRYTWATDSVDYLYRNNAVAGRGNDRFDPSGIITRGDFTLMVVKAYGLTASGSVSFSDVSAGKYYADAIRVAALLGIISADRNGCFYPDEAITRQDAFVIVYNAMKYSGQDVTNGLTADFAAYYDGGQIDTYAREAIGSLLLMGIVTGDGNGYLRPLGRLNRAESAVLMHMIMTL